MARRMRSDNKTITAIRMNNELYDEMEEIRTSINVTRTDFIERAVALAIYYMKLEETSEEGKK